MKLTDFSYDLPKELIAQHPAEPRDHARLMMYDRKSGAVEHRHFYDLAEELHEGDVLVFNDSRVIPARLYGKRLPTGGKVEVLLLTPVAEDSWEVLVKPGKKALPGTTLAFDGGMTAEVIDKTEFGGRILKFHYDGVFDDIIDAIGEMPLPPYIHEKMENPEEYQTVYARERGSAAAPTAGLHFTDELLEKIRAKGVEEVFITLHVGLGTFRPVEEENIEDHAMHSEFYSITKSAADTINQARTEGRRVIAVGTTSIRTLESAGTTGKLQAGSGWTNIFIYPGFTFHIVDALVTNFHLPESTLLMLISALSDRDKILHAYTLAVAEKYRFFSFGDAMFIR
ncbi:S-adenosylmethionine tRNA ribosyltransferase [Megasphaera cerevisiae DSM 20462]|uniref:S-adenosylmethionine:tRNA ribosyltransferase-isomerase n=1 Tax=Megasphaera cerevisiae DSM 20462 TaxID=1122219 RepID=A0A0J6WUB6_9FIRM|nr:tRNA preQ1(34) S-adenosylmethionine ribosyltransferase-isomerase QueA [Megasphaera cerevisiae]KMO85778.1 S-adenosylmethionine tRNA ribosyltransferase [Megasphaera cerevisiae DSM 20462]MCI1751007.1 tRNA preQ1(34) S-adenosylmethionine ribosyltransferase-isomerase QueA [Megasphaera cerevisiae]SKA10127.1 S-adenosylmethionine:tRNA ribosyltransferase-isomerase [Megasphaera cerevisiae DSM 20462]